jgi:hypothetical protein
LLPLPVLLLLGVDEGVPDMLGCVVVGVEPEDVCAPGSAALDAGCVGAAAPAAACDAGLPASFELQPKPASTHRVNEQDASVRAYVLVMTVPNATG